MDIFLKLFNMSITASWLVLVIIALRLILRKVPKAFHCVLWAMVAIRLICPISIQSMFSLIPTTQAIPQEVLYVQPSSTSAIANSVEIELLTNPVFPESVRDTVTVMTGGLQIHILFAYIIWLGGMAVMLAYTVISYLRLHIKVREAVRLRDNIWLCDHVTTPFILGVFRPKIFLPSSMREGNMQYVIAHEQAHLKRRDHLWKPLGFLLLTVYWFNPVLWIAYILLCRDIESACDEKVIRTMGEESKKPYADALISCAAPRRIISACPLAFGETGVKNRVKSVLNYKKPAFWLILVAIVACAAVSVYFLTDPMGVRLREKNETEAPTFITCSVDGETYKYTSESSIAYIIDLLYDVRVSAEPISENRSEDRDKTNTITFSYTDRSDVQYHFNAECDEVWINNGVKPTLTQRVYDPDTLQQFFENKIEESASTTGGADAPEKVYERFVFLDSEDPLSPTILLSKQDNAFQFTYSGLSSHVPMGTYELTDDQLVLWTSDRYYTYTFDAEKDEIGNYVFTFDAGKSSPLPTYRTGDGDTYTPVPDGGVFIYTGDQSSNSLQTGRAASFDIDGDGIIEQCVIEDTDLPDNKDAFLKVYSLGKLQLVGYLSVDAYDLNFAQDGEDTYILAKRSTGDHETVRLDMKIEDAEAYLYENGVMVGGTFGEVCY